MSVRIALLFAILCSASTPAGAQLQETPATPARAPVLIPPAMPEDSVGATARATIHRFFDAMRIGDTTSMRAAFLPGVVLVSVGDRGGEARLNTTTLDDLLASVGRAKERTPDLVLDERLGRVHVALDGDLASIWTEYEFWLGERFSHCGVNSFHLVRTSGEWRILHLADTRRTEGCIGQQR